MVPQGGHHKRTATQRRAARTAPALAESAGSPPSAEDSANAARRTAESSKGKLLDTFEDLAARQNILDAVSCAPQLRDRHGEPAGNLTVPLDCFGRSPGCWQDPAGRGSYPSCNLDSAGRQQRHVTVVIDVIDGWPELLSLHLPLNCAERLLDIREDTLRCRSEPSELSLVCVAVNHAQRCSAEANHGRA